MERLTTETLTAIRQRADICANHAYHTLVRHDIPVLLDYVDALEFREYELNEKLYEEQMNYLDTNRKRNEALSEVKRLRNGIDSVLYSLTNEDISDINVVEQIANLLRDVYNGGAAE